MTRKTSIDDLADFVMAKQLNWEENIAVFVGGLVGKNFSKPLYFYLDRSEEYLADLEKLG